MSKISLRAYNREIEQLVDQGQTDEAIAHCLHILKLFPKHVNTYQLLGKAYLESQRFGDAGDIFQRVLSSLPDNFVSHVGMSIIREDEGNMDAAIWHMERAFDVQPSNVAIQDELRRLYGKRDGVEPAQIRLTKGALARMYANGNLYSQAISELRTALNAEPERLDLQILLARVYHGNGQNLEAAKVSSGLISKLPFCLDANIILVEVFKESSRDDEIATYLERIKALDPYYTRVSEKFPTAEDVPDEVILLPKLDWDSSQAGLESQSHHPEWASSIGIGIEDSVSEEPDGMPDWLSPSAEDSLAGLNSSLGGSSVSPFTSPFMDKGNQDNEELPDIEDNFGEAGIMNDENIPEWMKDAGWEPRDPNEPEEPPAAFADSEPISTESDDEELAPADIPDWLQAMAPSDDDEAGETESDSEDGDVPDWLKDIAPPAAAAGVAAAIAGTSDEDTEIGEESALPDWIEESVTKEGGDTILLDPEESELAAPAEDIPDWLQDISQEERPEFDSEIGQESGVTAWLENLSTTQESADETEAADALPATDIPDWLRDISDSPITPAEESPVASIEESVAGEDLPEWLLGMEAESEQPETVVDSEAVTDVMPALEIPGAEENLELEEEEEELPDWLQSIGAQPESTEKIIEETIPPQEAMADTVVSDVPPWLQGLSEEVLTDATAEETKPEPEEEPVLAIEVPEETAVEALEEEPAAAEEITYDMEDTDAAMAWLESLAVKQGAREDELLTAPEQRTESLPEWLTQMTDETEDEAESEAEMVEETQDEITIPQPSMEADFSEEEPEDEESVFELVDEPEDELLFALEDEPDEEPLFEMEDEPDEELAFEMEDELDEELAFEMEDEPDEEPAFEAVDEAEDEGIAVELEEEPFAAVTEFAAVSRMLADTQENKTVPDTEMIAEEDSVEAEEEPAAELSMEEMDEDAAMAWLESLAAKQGAREDELLTPPEERTEDAPQWVLDAAEQFEEEDDLETVEESEELELEPEMSEEVLESEPEPEPVMAEEFEEVPEIEIFASEETVVEPSGMDEEEAIAWLESLAEDTSDDEELVAQEEDSEEPEDEVPAWVLEADSDEDKEDFAADAELEDDSGIPAWIFEPEEDDLEVVDEIGSELEIEEVEAVPDWMSDLETEDDEPEVEVEALAETEAVDEIEPEFEVEEFEVEEPAAIEEEPEAEPEAVPDWISEFETEAEQEEPVVEVEALEEDEPEAIDEIEPELEVEEPEIIEEEPEIFEEQPVSEAEAVEEEPAPEPVMEEEPVAEVEEKVPELAVVSSGEALSTARDALFEGQVGESLEHYNKLIKKKENLDEIIGDLTEALQYRYPVDVEIWQTLGDAYARSERLQDALDSYTKAEELIR